MTTSTHSSSPSETPKTPVTFEKLLGSQKKLRVLVEVFRGSQWEAVEEWLQAERQEHLRAVEDSSDTDVMNYHLTIARWLREFLGVTKDRIIEVANAPEEPEDPERTDSGSDYVVGSGEID